MDSKPLDKLYLVFSMILRKLTYFARESPHFFPTLSISIFVALSLLGIHSSSIGQFYGFMNNGPDSSLVAGRERGIRSDEWSNFSFLTVGQIENNFDKINKNIGPGINYALQPDIPTNDWSTIFRPHNWLFFVAPFDVAFAFKWWMPVCLLLVSSYYFSLRKLGKRGLATLASLAFTASPFILWWSQTSVWAILGYALIIIMLFEDIIRGRKRFGRASIAVNSLLLSFSMSAFLLHFYPPFQIPIILVSAAYLLGYLLNNYSGIPGVGLLRKTKVFLPVAISILLVLGLGAMFVHQNQDTLTRLTDSVYPGHRVISGGTLPLINLADGFLMPILQSGHRAANFFTNQSEASNFILVAPFLLLPSFALLYAKYRQSRIIDYAFLTINLCIVFFLLRDFTTIVDPVAHLLLLDKVPNTRLTYGVGFAGFIQLLLFIKIISSVKLKRSKLLLTSASGYAAACLAIIMLVGARVTSQYPLFIHNKLVVLCLALGFTSIIFFAVSGRAKLTLLALAGFTIISSAAIHPLYRGTSVLTTNKLVTAMDAVSDKRVTWATVDSVIFSGFGALAGDNTVTGIYSNPRPDYWDPVFGEQYSEIFDRQAHVIMTTKRYADNQPIYLEANSTFSIDYSCENLRKLKVDYILSKSLENPSCTTLIKTVKLQKSTLYILKFIT